MSRREITENEVPIAVEDKFIIFSFGRGRSLCPHVSDADRLGELVQELKGMIPIFDLRGLEGYYNDIHQFIMSVSGGSSYVILGDGQVESGWGEELTRRGSEVISAKGLAHKTAMLERRLFESDQDKFFIEAFLYDSTRLNQLRKRSYLDQAEAFKKFVSSIHANSLLVEFVMASNGDKIVLSPYHGHAIHNVETKREAILVGRPAVIARTTRMAFAEEISIFEQLINSKNVKERHIQRFLEDHPNFLRGLNYQNVYPQIVLERDGDGSLIPDFILEPFDGAFCDILDIKLPNQAMYVGGKDRGQLASGLHAVAAQLREYAAYFEQERYRRFVSERYGLRIYRPRLIAVVGRDIKQMADDQFRRAITAYDNLQFMTFDELIRHAKYRALV